jgi:hypothetical protein
MAGHHDLGYTFLFAHPELVRELLADFTDFPALGGLAADAFERVNPGYVSDRFSERHDDIVWRARVGEQWLYIYILLEFQSGVDHWRLHCAGLIRHPLMSSASGWARRSSLAALRPCWRCRRTANSRPPTRAYFNTDSSANKSAGFSR